MKAGYVVVVPSAMPQVNGASTACWWRIDPKTGETLGMTEAGGSSKIEDSFMIRLMVTAWVATTNWLGCTGVSKTTGGGKALGCAICSAIAAVLFWFAYAGAYGGAGRIGGFAAGPNGTGAGGALGGICAIYGAAAPSD